MNSNTRSAIIGNLACFIAYLIFGFNIIFCKNIADCGLVSPMSLYLMRALGALALFWLISLFTPRESIELRDMWKVAVASLLGLFLTQLTFLKAVTLTTALDISILSLLSPIMALLVAVAFRREKITVGGVVGLAISFFGVLFLVLNTVSIRSGAAHTSLGGIVLMLVNTLSFASYIVLFKRTIKKYSVVTFMKWMFLFSTLYALPFGLKGLFEVDYAALTPSIVWQILFVVVCSTFISYFLIPIGQKRLHPVLLCMYTYVQPIVAMAISLAAGMDTMTWGKALATVLVFAGVSLVNFAGKSRH